MAATDNRDSADLKLEVVTLPVSDLDRAKDFYAGLGWRLDADFVLGGARAIQFTPPGSACSIHFATGPGAAAPGSAQGLFLVVPDVQAARERLAARGFGSGRFFTVRRKARRTGPRRTGRRTTRSPRSAIRTGTAGCCRR
ncbi:VOC family protein [Actinoplanes sp. NPDC049681]|uniref:VOC family protein n=1 Tax=Actinoplanes sp. NPDC049681 TaxID=3363905 RepID=UPI0037892393